ncbi:unnamed protein product [Lactuca saligna]|uniref:ATP-dependent DNA helicase n=1 Tax=Lactuca saligna TaxID=75948 RepID=A0AA36E9L4_LACSI|nr:unnamed protein product [Lactuca saligna]
MSSSRKKRCASELFLASSGSSSSTIPKRTRLRAFSSSDFVRPLPTYDDSGDCSFVYQFCGALFWHGERVIRSSIVSRPCYTHCCKSSTIVLPSPLTPPPVLRTLYDVHAFRLNIRAYNNMFAMTSFGDTENEASNRLYAFNKPSKPPLDEELDSYVVCLFNDVLDQRYGPPTPSTLGCVVFGDDFVTNKYDVILYAHSGNPQRISKLHPSYMALQYPLLFPYGEGGWSPHLKLVAELGNDGRKLTVNMYYSYKIHARDGVYSFILNASGLFQGDVDSRSIWKCVLLPPSFVGGPCYMYNDYQDALSICREYGNPQYFITFTCNVNWPEIRRYMIRHSQMDAHSRVGIISRVFHIKFKALINFLKEDKKFGAVTAHLHTIEFQNRGLPHYHTLLWVCNLDKIREAADIDKFISAEIPDPVSEPLLYQTIKTSMIHGPCGLLNIKCPCMKDGKCSKRYRKPFSDSTVIDKQGYAHCRRNTLARHTLQNAIEIDNGYIVPYNKHLCNRFNAHINVEYCGWNMMIKYLFNSLLLGWFENNKWDKGGLDLTYGACPSKYVWNKRVKRWKLRERITLHAIGQIAFVHPSDGELFYIRMLLFHQKVCKSNEDVSTVYNRLHPNFRSAFDALDLIGDDKEWLLAFTQLVLLEVEKVLRSCTPSKSVTEFNLSLPSDHVETFFQNRLRLDETSYDREELSNQHIIMVSRLNSEQLNIYNVFVSAINDGNQVMFFIYRHGGTGKTFLWTTLLSYFRSIGKIALAVAASDHSLRDILDCDSKVFGGMSELLGGDFRQTLLVSPQSNRWQNVALTLPKLYLWSCFTMYKLKYNIRLLNDDIPFTLDFSVSTFASWLLKVGYGDLGYPDVSDTTDAR